MKNETEEKPETELPPLELSLKDNYKEALEFAMLVRQKLGNGNKPRSIGYIAAKTGVHIKILKQNIAVLQQFGMVNYFQENNVETITFSIHPVTHTKNIDGYIEAYKQQIEHCKKCKAAINEFVNDPQKSEEMKAV